MKFPIVIAATYRLAEHLCRSILEINPRNHAMSAHTAARQGLVGYDKPVVIIYCEEQSDIWIMEDLVEVHKLLKICNAVVINLPEVTRVSRPVGSW